MTHSPCHLVAVIIVTEGAVIIVTEVTHSFQRRIALPLLKAISIARSIAGCAGFLILIHSRVGAHRVVSRDPLRITTSQFDLEGDSP
jgi:hypothetical protein